VPDADPRPGADFAPTSDVLLRDPLLAHVSDLPVLGVPTRFETNSGTVARIVEDAFGDWRRLDAGGGEREDVGRDPARVLRVRIVVHEGSEHVDGRAPVRHICPDATRVIAHSPGSVAISDPMRREAVAFVSSALVADRAHFRDAILEAVTLALISHFDRHPVHAAAVGRGERVVLLAGESGAGKSTLAYAAHGMGLDVLGDDRVWVQLAPRFRVWGWPGRVRLRPETWAILPELAAHRPAEPSAGDPSHAADERRKIVVAIGGGPGESRCTAADVVVCVLERTRSGARPTLERLGAEDLREALAHGLAAGFDRFPERHERVVGTLARDGGWRLGVPAGGDPRAVLSMLMRAAGVDGVGAPRGP
jgi:hypothetical protein